MNRVGSRRMTGLVIGLIAAFTLGAASAQAQNFDFARLEKQMRGYTVVLDMKIEISFGMQTHDQDQRALATVVTADGLVAFDGTTLASEQSFSSMAGMTVKVTPTQINVLTLDGKKFTATYVGVDRFTKIGFAKIDGDIKGVLSPIVFATNYQFNVGKWFALYMLLPEFVKPPIAADIGMISTIIESPEKFPLLVGFSPIEVSSVLFDTTLTPVGILGTMLDPSSGGDPSGGGFDQFDIPLLGVITGERLNALVAEPPKKGEIDRAWLGITLQALTQDLGEFLDVKGEGGIIVNEVIKDSPAEKSGLKVGDIIYAINGQPLDIDMDEKIPIFQRRISQMAPGTNVEFSIFRPGSTGTSIDTMTILAELVAAPIGAVDAPSYEVKELELKFRDLVFADYVGFNLEPGEVQGVVVSELKRGGLASIGGLEIGDVIQRVSGTPVSSVNDVRTVFEQLRTDKPREVVFFVWRDNRTLFVNVKTDWQKS